MTEISREDLSYIACFLETEGCAFVNSQGKYRYGQFKFSQADQEIIEWIHVVLEAGNVYRVVTKPGGYNRNGCELWTLVIARQEDVVRVARLLWPYTKMKGRRRRIKAAYHAAKR
jgi:hypothetical protein